MSGEWPPAQDAEPPATPLPPGPAPRFGAGEAYPPYGSPTYGSPGYGPAPYITPQYPSGAVPPTSPYGPQRFAPGPPQHWNVAPPQHLSDQLPPRPPRRGGWLVALLTVVGLILLGLVAVLVLPSLGDLQVPGLGPSATSRPSPHASSTKKPSSKPTATMPTDPKDILKKNPIYALKVPAKCDYEGRPATATAFRAQVKALVGCENAAWKKALASTPVRFEKPKITFYGSRTSSPCGKLGSTFPAAYCGPNRTLYFSTASYQQGRYYRLAVAQFAMHEYAHHIQQLAEILPSSWVMDENAATTSRRIELQAHCMAHYQLTHSGLGFTSSDRSDLEYQFGYTNDASGHGSTTAERYWGRRGLSAKTIGACDTWSVKPRVVR